MRKTKTGVGTKILGFLGFDSTFRSSIPSMINYNWAVFLGNASFYIIGLFFIPFLTKVEGLSTAQAGVVVLCAKLCDAFTDPAMGIITDRTRTRFGRHRLYLLIGLLPVAVTYFMMWYSFGIDNSHTTAKMLYFIGAYMLFSTAYTLVIVPHTAMLPVLAPKYNLRTQYNAMKTILDAIGTEGSFLIATLILSYVRINGKSVPGSVINALGNTPEFDPSFKHRFMLMGLVLCLFFSLPLLATFFGTKEPSSLHDENPPFNLRAFLAEYRSIVSNRAFRQYFALSFCNCIALGFISNTSYYFLCNVAGMVGLYTITNFISQAGEAAGFPLNYVISVNLSKQAPAKIELPFIIVALLLSFTVKEGGSQLLLILVYIFYNFGLAGVNSVTGNIFPDVTDVDEMISGERREGKVATFSSMIKKIVSGLSAAITGFILSAFGFNPDAAQNTPTALFGVRFTYAILPIIFIIGSIISAYKYKMTKTDHALIKRAIEEKKSTGTTTLTDGEKQICEQIAGQKWENMWIGAEN
ncbi:MAG: MFS transporter [Clostridia bacterium]|nr:MFS transporter [Clostridia bacterium]